MCVANWQAWNKLQSHASSLPVRQFMPELQNNRTTEHSCTRSALLDWLDQPSDATILGSAVLADPSTGEPGRFRLPADMSGLEDMGAMMDRVHHMHDDIVRTYAHFTGVYALVAVQPCSSAALNVATSNVLCLEYLVY